MNPCLTEVKGQWRKVEKLVYKNMKGALKKGSLGLLEVVGAMEKG